MSSPSSMPPQILEPPRSGLFSLRVLLPLIFLLFTIVVLGYMYRAALEHDRLESEADMLREQASRAGHLQADIENFLRDQEVAHVRTEFAMLSAEADISAALFADEQGKVIFASQMAWIGRDASSIAPFAQYAGTLPILPRTLLSPDRKSVLSVYPIMSAGKEHGLVPQQAGILFMASDLSFTLSERNARTTSWMRQTTLLVGLLLLLAWLILHFTVSRRVGSLLRAMGHVGLRRVNVVSGVSGRDEIGQIGQAFDEMMATLVQSSARVRKLSQAVEQSASAIIITDKQGVIEYVNPAFTAISGYTPEEALGNKANILKSGEVGKELYAQLWETITAGGTWRGELRNQRKDGRMYWDAVVISPVRDEEGEITHFVAVQEDITARKASEKQLLLGQHILNSIKEGIAVTDAERNICFVNPAFSAITGYGGDEVFGRNPRVLQSGLMDETFYRGMWRSISETGGWQGEIVDRRKNGDSYPEWLSISSLKDAAGKTTHYVSVFSDISERKAAEARIAHLAKHDFLTGLPNRMLLQDRLAQAIFRAMRDGHKVAVMFLDLDRFKAINDTLGHLVGDKLLREVANRISQASRAGDTVCRQGGDEFVILLQDIESADDAAVVAAKMLETVSGSYRVNDNEIEVTTSIGISMFPEDGKDGESLVSHADAAMYHAKKNGRNNFQFYTDEMNRHVLERVAIEKKLRHALEHSEFSLHYQPQVDLRTNQIVGVEALLRWNNPERGMISPAEFIPIAEDTGLIVPIGEWVLREACRQSVAWRDAGLPSVVAVNLSAVQFRHKSMEEVFTQILSDSSVNPAMIELEITESAVMQDVEAAIALLRRLKELGVKIAVDDFGTGYSSLSYLKRFPIDKLKIDQSFVRDVTQDPDDAAIIRTIISMASSLGLKVIAEGVETEAQKSFLIQYACDEMQGYFFSRPMPADACTEFFRRNLAG